MAVKKNKNNTYYVQGSYVDAFGSRIDYKRFTGKNGFKRKKDAIEWERVFKIEKEKERQLNFTANGSPTFSEVKRMYFKQRKSLKESTRIAYEQSLVKFNTLNDIPVNDITVNMINKCFDNFINSDYSKNYIMKLKTSIKLVFEFAVQEHYILESPLLRMRGFRDFQEPLKINNDTKFWTYEQVQKYLNAIDEEKYFVLFNFLYLTGVRKGEAQALQWKDIDLDNKTYHIYKTYNAKIRDENNRLTQPKTKNSIRTQMLPDLLVELLLEYSKSISQFKDILPDDFIFGGEKPFSNSSLDRYHKKITEKVNNPKMVIHGFRHSHVSFLINNGVDAQQVAARIGDTYETVIKTYTHFFKSREDSIMNILNEKLSNKK